MNIEQDIESLRDRNRRVEADKAWETSAIRIFILSGITYVVAGVTLWLIDAASPWLTALVPTIGFYFSTLTLPPVKRWWLRKYSK